MDCRVSGVFNVPCWLVPDVRDHDAECRFVTQTGTRRTLIISIRCCHLCRRDWRAESGPVVSATLTTMAFDHSSLRWLGISSWSPNPKGPPSSLIHLRNAVSTGAVRHTRPSPERRPLSSAKPTFESALRFQHIKFQTETLPKFQAPSTKAIRSNTAWNMASVSLPVLVL